MLGIHGAYFIWPVAAFVFWTATLLGLLLWWAVDDNAKQYKVDQYTVVYISNVGAAHQTLFIVGSALTFVFFSITLLCERWLRHIRRIPGVLQKKERIADILAVVFGILGGLALLMLSVFNAVKYPHVHWSFTAIFVVCIALSAVFQTLEVMWLERDHVERAHLRRNAIIKLTIVSLAVAGAVAFGATYGVCASGAKDQPPTSKCERVGSASAVLEWFIAFLFDAYLFSYILDLWPATKTRGHKFHDGLIDADRANRLKHPEVGAANGSRVAPFEDDRTLAEHEGVPTDSNGAAIVNGKNTKEEQMMRQV